MTELHPDPIGDSGQKVFQYVQLLAMAAEAVAVIAAARSRAAAERKEQKAEAINTGVAVNHKVAAALWAPVLADHQRDSLDVAQTLTAWSAAQAWQADDPDALLAAVAAEERLHELRPAAMMRYDDLRSQGLDPVAAMRQVVSLLDGNPRIGETTISAHALTAEGNTTRLVAEQYGLDAGRLPDSTATRVHADELDREHDGHEPCYGLSGHEVTHGVDPGRVDGPHLGWDGRDVNGSHEDHIVAVADGDAPTANPAGASAPSSVATVDIGEAAALLVAESALLTQIQEHRLSGAQEGHVASNADSFAALDETSDHLTTRVIDQEHDGVGADQLPAALVVDAGDHAHLERQAAQALAASFPTAASQVAAASFAAAPATKLAAATRSAPNPSMVRR